MREDGREKEEAEEEMRGRWLWGGGGLVRDREKIAKGSEIEECNGTRSFTTIPKDALLAKYVV
jgi:hypothetical protein